MEIVVYIGVFQGRDSPTLKLYYLSLLLALSQIKTLLEEKTVIVELGESWPRFSFMPFHTLDFIYLKLDLLNFCVK